MSGKYIISTLLSVHLSTNCARIFKKLRNYVTAVIKLYKMYSGMIRQKTNYKNCNIQWWQIRWIIQC